MLIFFFHIQHYACRNVMYSFILYSFWILVTAQFTCITIDSTMTFILTCPSIDGKAQVYLIPGSISQASVRDVRPVKLSTATHIHLNVNYSCVTCYDKTKSLPWKESIGNYCLKTSWQVNFKPTFKVADVDVVNVWQYPHNICFSDSDCSLLHRSSSIKPPGVSCAPCLLTSLP